MTSTASHATSARWSTTPDCVAPWAHRRVSTYTIASRPPTSSRASKTCTARCWHRLPPRHAMPDTASLLRVAVVARAVMPLHRPGGLERSVRDLVRHLASHDVDVTLIVPPPTVNRECQDDPFASPRIHIRHVTYLTFPGAN